MIFSFPQWTEYPVAIKTSLKNVKHIQANQVQYSVSVNYFMFACYNEDVSCQGEPYL